MGMDDDARRRRERDAAEEERHYWDSLEDARRADEEEAARKREAAIEMMTSWFFEQFEDPQYDTPIDGEEQAYIYAWGGPFEAADVLHGQFGGEHDESLIMEAVETVERDGIVEWAPTSTGEFYEHPDPDDVVDPVAQAATSQALTSQILDRLATLETIISALPGTAGNVGHNAPPAEVGIPPYADEDARGIRAAIAETRVELAGAAPDPAKLATLSQRFKRYAAKIGSWAAKKGDLAVDETIKNVIKAVSWASALGLLGEVAHGLLELAKHLLMIR